MSDGDVHTRFFGALKVAGAAAMGYAAVLNGWNPLGVWLGARAVDVGVSGAMELATGQEFRTLTNRALGMFMDREFADLGEGLIDIAPDAAGYARMLKARRVGPNPTAPDVAPGNPAAKGAGVDPPATSFPEGATGCFPAGTLVKVLKGDGSVKHELRPIEDIRPGDVVLAGDEATGRTENRRVVRKFRRFSERMMTIRYAPLLVAAAVTLGSAGNAAAGDQSAFDVTPGHPLFVERVGAFVKASDLRAGDVLRMSDGSSAVVSAVEHSDAPAGRPFEVYNFEVEGLHTYFVAPETSPPSAPAVWVHNTACPEPVFIDTSAATAFVSEGSETRHLLKPLVAGKQMMMSSTAYAEFTDALRRLAGPLERARGEALLRRVVVVADQSSPRVAALPISKRIKATDKAIFGTADEYGALILTGDAGFVRAARTQGVPLNAFVHPPAQLRRL